MARRTLFICCLLASLTSAGPAQDEPPGYVLGPPPGDPVNPDDLKAIPPPPGTGKFQWQIYKKGEFCRKEKRISKMELTRISKPQNEYH